MRRGRTGWTERGQGARRAAALVFLLFAAGCAREPTPAWWDGGPSRPAPAAQGRVSAGGLYAVQRGDTVYRIARSQGVSIRALIDENGLQPPYDIYPGQKLRIPRGRYHTVQRGETVYSISRRYDVDMASLTQRNNIPPPYEIRVGEKLQIPGRGTQVQTASGVPRPQARPTPGRPESANARLALTLPLQRPSRSVGTPVATAQPTRSPVPPPPASSGSFVWPVQGKVISSYGPKANGLHNDGVNIAVAEGTPVHAAQTGVVAYAGNELKGYGNLLLIRHSNGWVTAYAHNSRLLVKRGDRVTRGQEIALAGKSGSVVTPQVHFEIRKGAKALNPNGLIGS
ncbi:murein DD-endopeptidase MepM/ murein hydrolase activator NlpD [Parvibaculum indicum]|uniref:M23 family metallopeptidase n=1 Tax=Parvibaculum indicum TaxID=562969 RepID=UPI00141DD02D|nr:M23 family metallopeptidase [Parvibaculum indicum]NIJ39832.1 murein DD-endopeptidase MepM/ murein hydrolase activator NlpD [Parvibaculum indicum]